MKNQKTIIFDFHGVLCHDYFYQTTLRVAYPEIYLWIQNNIFGEDDALVKQWMRGIRSHDEVTLYIAECVEVPHPFLKELFVKSIQQMRIHPEVLGFIKLLKDNHYKTLLVTDNMDIFNEITVKKHSLDTYFDVIINSADHGLLKLDENGKLFDIALEMAGEKHIENTILIDDSVDNIELYKHKGGQTFHYKNNLEELSGFLSNYL